MSRIVGLALFLMLIGSACSFGTKWPNFFARSYSTDGERIYYSGVGGDGRPIAYSGRSRYRGMMISSQLSCASCHGEDGRGGIHFMRMDLMQAPDITYSALSTEQDENSETEGEHSHGAADYNLDDFRQAVVFGSHPNGEALDNDMPRWQIDNEDLAELYAFLQTLP